MSSFKENVLRRIASVGVITGLLVPTSVTGQVCPATWTLTAPLTYDDSDAPLVRPRDVVITSNGTAVVSESDEPVLKVFSRDGRSVRTWGRRGDGPGEFREVTGLLSSGDSVWAYDGSHRRGTFYRNNGALGKEVTFAQRSAPEIGPTFPLGDRYLGLATLYSAALAAPGGSQRRVLLVRTSGTIERDLVQPLLIRGYNTQLRLPGEGSMFLPLPVPLMDRVVVAEGGASAVVARGAFDNRSGSRRLRVTKLDADGDTIFSKTILIGPAPVTTTYLDDHQHNLVKAIVQRFPSELAAKRAVQEAMKTNASQFYPVNGLIADNDGRIWIRTTLARNDWLVLGSSGAVLACAQAPVDLRLVAAAGRSVWAIKTDSDDVRFPQRFEIRKH